eukprot:TRINITY_DN3979_c0_g1_i3.p1 TRINITY_DN3979_c0_g1~~TRINITY_DN3979_c0_g1_i3.p1  ORF type:complete len:766 (+),score=188.14 TRINITY_DN3979_c0_g1_i3:217-2514(+)
MSETNNNNAEGSSSSSSNPGCRAGKASNSRGQGILPKEGERNVLITSALPYVNNVPHLGNIIGSVLSADVYARYSRLRGVNTLFVCGTDEYGTATETKALQEGLTPKQICDKYNRIHAQIYDWFNISFDIFGRTSTPQQSDICQDIFKRLHDNDQLVEQTIEQLYCDGCKKFLADRFVEGTCPSCSYEDARGDQCDRCGKLLNPVELKDPRCKVCSSTPTVKPTTHMFLDLRKLQPKIEDFVKESSHKGLWSSNAIQITGKWINETLEPRCITRDLQWGVKVPLPGYESKVFYVWFDAPIGYISITANYTPEWEKWWKNPNNVELFQFMGKDNVPFHTVIFPACLIGTGVRHTLLNHISTTEYLNYEDGKFSKSRGTGVFGDGVRDTGIPPEVWRYYLLANRPEQSDSIFSWEDFGQKNNAELLSCLGNYVNRSLKFVVDRFDSKVPPIGKLHDIDNKFIEDVNKDLTAYLAAMDKISEKEGLHIAMGIVQIGNKYIQDTKPWELVTEDKERCGTIVSLSVNLVHLIIAIFEPFLPSFSDKVRDQLKSEPHQIPSQFKPPTLAPHHEVGEVNPIFERLEKDRIEAFKEKFAGDKKGKFPAELKTGKILSVAPHPDAEHLYILQVSMGKDKRYQIVSGLREFYPDSAELVDKNVVVLVNIKQSKFKGALSQGMILTGEQASADGKLRVGVLSAKNPEPGLNVLPSGYSYEKLPKYDTKKFAQLDLVVDEQGFATFKNTRLEVERNLPDGSRDYLIADHGVVSGKVK